MKRIQLIQTNKDGDRENESPVDRISLQAIITLDFATRFPHIFWISTWSKDDVYPDGFRYKILSARQEDNKAIELVVILEQKNGYKKEMKRLRISSSAFDRTAQTFIDGLAEGYGITFSELNLSSVQTLKQFDQLVKENGWYER